jgi:hypothetical protein
MDYVFGIQPGLARRSRAALRVSSFLQKQKLVPIVSLEGILAEVGYQPFEPKINELGS